MSRISCMPAGSSPFMGSSRISSWGSPEQAGGHPETLAHTHGVLRHPVVGPVQDADPLERRSDAVARRRLTRRGQDLQVLAPGQMAVEPGLVDDGPHPGQGRGPVAGHGWPSSDMVPESAWVSPEQRPDERGLAGAVGAQVAEGTSPGDQELHAVHGDVLPELLGQPMGLHRPPAPVAAGPVTGLVRAGGQRGRGHTDTLDVVMQ
jgi:hypothetical protein